jgi:superfamily II DNA or RNA helicase
MSAAAPAATGVALRPYQTAALEAVRKHYDAGVRRMLLVAATGAGKTVTFSHLPQTLGLAPTDKVLILAHRDELVQQARAKYLACNPGEMVGIEKAERRASPMDRVAIASVQTLRGDRIRQFLGRFGKPALIVTDEAHHGPAQGYQAVYAACGVSRSGDVVHVGVTATPKRSDKIGLQDTFDVIAHTVAIDELIDLGYLVPLVGYSVQTTTDLDAVRTTAGDFNASDLEDAVDTEERNAAVVRAYADICPNAKAIVFAASVEHSEALQRAFEAAGYPCVHVDGKTALFDRQARLQAFSRGSFRVLANCGIATEGYDEPSVECVIIARPTKSAVLMTQMIGRCTRLHPGKKRGIVIDMVDVTKRHSVVSLPSLFGMPSNFDLAGRSATDVAKKYAKVVGESPELEPMLNSVADLDAVENIAATERFKKRLDFLLEQARKTNQYVDVNLLRPPALDAETARETILNWIATADDSYLLRVENDTVKIHGDLVGQHSVVITRSIDGKTAHRTLGTYASRSDALMIADDWIRRNHAERAILVDRNAGWRDAPASEKQIAILERHRIASPERLSRGKASELIDILFASKSKRGAA